MKSISKSRFVSGVKCSKKIYFEYFRKDLKLPVSAATQQIFDLGHTVGTLAQKSFPDGKDATPEDFSDFSKSIENGLLKKRKPFTKLLLLQKILW